VAEPDPAPRVPQPIALLAALLAVIVLWLSRDLIGVQVGVRLLLPVLWLAVWTSACVGVGWWSLRLLAGPGDRPSLVEVLAAGAAVLAWRVPRRHRRAAAPGLLQVTLGLAAVEVGGCCGSSPGAVAAPIGLSAAPAILLAAAGAATWC
jgi:hypothetical protein